MDASRAEFAHMTSLAHVQVSLFDHGLCLLVGLIGWDVKVIDWSPDKVSDKRFEGSDFLRWFSDGKGSSKPKWAKARWINVCCLLFLVLVGIQSTYVCVSKSD